MGSNEMEKMDQTAVVIGGGAAGMMAAVMLGRRGIRTTLLEKNEKLGKKIFITGKGRCNFTNDCEAESFFDAVQSDARFLRSAYARFSAQEAIRFFEDAGMAVKVERGRRAFPVSDHAYDVTDALRRELKKAGVRVLLNTRAEELLFEEYEGKKRVCGVRVRETVSTDRGEKNYEIPADRVVIATGGLSYPTTGSTGDGYAFAVSAGHTVTDRYPSLVPLYVGEPWPAMMAGLSLKNVTLTVKVKGKKNYEGFGELLFTHKGLSGPLVLTASSVCAKDLALGEAEALIDLKPKVSAAELDRRLDGLFRQSPRMEAANAVKGVYPRSLIPALFEAAGVDPVKKAGLLTKEERGKLVSATKEWRFTVTGTAGYNEAVITKGGVSVREIDPKTMRSRLCEGLYFAGELLDMDALTGGFNLQIAWTTGYAAGNAQ